MSLLREERKREIDRQTERHWLWVEIDFILLINKINDMATITYILRDQSQEEIKGYFYKCKF